MPQLITSAAPCSNGFFSRKLDSAQVKFSAFDRELLTCFQAIRHFRFMLEGQRFTLFTDHKLLTTAVRLTTELWTAKQCRVHERYPAHSGLRQRGSRYAVQAARRRHCRGRLESPPHGTDLADRGDKDKIKLSTLSGGLRSSVEALPEVNAVRATTAVVDYAALAAHQGACPAQTAGSVFNILRVRRRDHVRCSAGATGADPGRGRAAAGRLHRQTVAIRFAAAFTPPFLCADGGQAGDGVVISGIRVHPEERRGSPLVAALQRPVQGPRLRPEGVPAAGGRAGVGFHRPP
jgi:hypothetical protein